MGLLLHAQHVPHRWSARFYLRLTLEEFLFARIGEKSAFQTAIQLPDKRFYVLLITQCLLWQGLDAKKRGVGVLMANNSPCLESLDLASKHVRRDLLVTGQCLC